MSILLLGKDQSSRSMKIFREGRYKMGDIKLADKRLELIKSFADYLPFAWTRNFVRAVGQLSTIPKYDHKKMISRIKRKTMKKQASVELYMEEIRSIYNTASMSDYQRI